MPVAQKFSYRQADGTIIPHDSDRIHFMLEDWIKSLSEIEQQEYREADKRQKALRKQVIDEGNLSIAPGGTKYVWKDEKACKNGKPEDPVWGKYWRRYMTETKQQVVVTYENV
jgi:hypothetical protein